jgi:hypothetical protein
MRTNTACFGDAMRKIALAGFGGHEIKALLAPAPRPAGLSMMPAFKALLPAVRTAPVSDALGLTQPS